MTSRFVSYVAVLALVSAMATLPVAAQFAGPPPTPEEEAAAKAAPTPRTANGHPDLTGFWGTVVVPGSGDTKVSADGKTIELQIQTPKTIIAQREAGRGRGGEGGRGGRGAAASRPEYKPELLAKVKALHDDTVDQDPSGYGCMPEGVPRMGAPSEIFQSANAIAFLYESRNVFRVIPTDGRPHDKTLDPSYMGDGVGHWDGDTLVVDVTRFNDQTWLAGESGYFHTEDLHVVERFTRQGNTILYEVTVEDPNVLAKPWVMNPRTLRLSKNNDHLTEDPPCVEKDQPHLLDKYHINP